MLEKREYEIYRDLFGDAELAFEEIVHNASEDSYLDDVVMEVADSFVPINNYELCSKCFELAEEVEEAREEGIIPEGASIFKQLAIGAYNYYTNIIYQNLEAIVFNLAYEYLVTEYSASTVALADTEGLEEALEGVNTSCGYIQDILGRVDSYVMDLLEEEE